MITSVKLSKQARSDLLRVPQHIRRKLAFWIDLVEKEGLEQVRRISGFHDEPLKGLRQNQRSIRLNHAYGAIYILATDSLVHFVEIIEVNKHDY